MSNLITSASRRSATLNPARKPPVGSLGRLQALPTGLKVGAVLAVLIGGLVWLMVSQRQQAQQPSALFAYKLTPRQVEECAQRLSKMGVEHRPNPDGTNLMVAPDKRMALLNQLSLEGLPHQDAPEANSPMTPSQREALARQQAQLQLSLDASLRGMQGIDDATVQLAIPESGVFEDGHPTASVLLRLQPGYELPRSQSNGIAKFVAGAVPYLRSEDVTVVDQTGREKSTDGSVDSVQFELQKQLDVYLASKAQRLLDMAYGRGNSMAIVTVELDFSQFEVKNKDVGAPGDSENRTTSQKTVEIYQNLNTSSNPSSAVDDEVVGEKPNNKKYEKVCEASRQNPDEAFTWRVYKLPRVARVSCSVLLEATGQDKIALQMVQGAIGFDASRGDTITASVVPLHHENSGLKAISPLAVPVTQPGPGDPLFSLVGLAGALLLGAGIWTLGQRRVQLKQPNLKISPAMSTHTQCDLNYPADGRTPPTATQPRVLEQLESLARKSPRETASLLRSYMDTNTMDN